MRLVPAFLLLFICTQLFAQFEEEVNPVASEFIVMLKPEHNITSLLQEMPAVAIKECLSERMKIYLLKKNVTTTDETLLYTLKSNAHVKLAQFNHQFAERTVTPNDPNFNQQWNMLNTGQNSGYPGADIEATEAWQINTDNLTADGDTIVIAVIDGKVDLLHEDINFFTNYSEVAGNGIDDDNNGYIDDVNGWNAYQNTGDVSGIYDHSMHVAGIAAAKGDNGLGVAGVCWGAKILPVIHGSTVESNVVKAYDYVREMRMLYDNTFGTKGAFIVSTNSSFGVDNGLAGNYPIWCAMYDSMGAAGILSAGATANTNTNVDLMHDIPTECPSNYLLTVTSTNRIDVKSSGAAYGQTTIDMGAPGTQVFSTYHGNQYNLMNGTSMSTPHVAGAVAAMYAAACKGLIDAYHEHPDSIALLIKDYLLDAAEWNSSLNNITTTNGRLNLYRAIQNLRRYNCDSCSFSLRIEKADISCSNLNDGAMAAVFSPGTFDDYQILWSNTVTDPECLNMAPGFYTVSVTDTNGCRRTYTEELHAPDSIHIMSINTVPADGGNNGNITINAAAGNEPLLYSIDGISYQSGYIFTILANGSYTVYVKSTSGCVAQQTILISGTEEVADDKLNLNLSPNPAANGLNLSVNSSRNATLPLRISDMLGHTLLQTTQTINSGLSSTPLDISALPNGIYLLHLGGMSQRFVVVK